MNGKIVIVVGAAVAVFLLLKNNKATAAAQSPVVLATALQSAQSVAGGTNMPAWQVVPDYSQVVIPGTGQVWTPSNYGL